MEIIGHRGAAGLAPENTLSSIQAALKHNVNMIELDLRMQNKVVVLAHDKPLRGTINCPLRQALKEINGAVPINLEIKEKACLLYTSPSPRDA